MSSKLTPAILRELADTLEAIAAEVGYPHPSHIVWNPIALRKEADVLEQPVIEGYGT